MRRMQDRVFFHYTIILSTFLTIYSHWYDYSMLVWIADGSLKYK
jgi:hypothetical protein